MGGSDLLRDSFSIAVYSFTFLLGLPSNLLVLSVYVRKASKHGATPNVVYGLNLCVANMVLVAWQPLKAVETLLPKWPLPPPLCPVYSLFLFASLYGSCLLLMAVAVGRYLSIAFPISYKRYRRARFSCLISTGLWGLVLLHLGLALAAESGDYFVSASPGANASVCFDNFTERQLEILLPLRLEMSVVLFLLPLAITAGCTLRCLMLVRRSGLSSGGKRRVLGVALTTLTVFVVCYAPYNVSHVVGFLQGRSVFWRREAMLFSSCNVFLEPVVILLLSPIRSRGLAARLCGVAASARR